jgi:hypothetical protein
MSIDKITVNTKCIFCGKVIDIEFTTKQYLRYLEWKEGKISHIQDALPELSADNRELLISGVCGECFDNMFKGEEEIN